MKTAINELNKSFMEFKKAISSLIDLFLWLSPLILFLLVMYIPKVLWNLNFTEYLEFLNILVWPYTVLIILFFFKKVVTYLFFSMNKFNFFGIKGDLKNVYELISEEAEKKFSEEKEEKKRNEDMDDLNNRIIINEKEILEARGSAVKNLKLAKDIMKNLKDTEEASIKVIYALKSENKELKKNILSSSSRIEEEASSSIIDDEKTSDPVSEESSIK